MSSDYQYIQDHMGGWNEETGLPNFMDEPGFGDDSYDDEDNYNEKNENDNLEVEFHIGDIVKLNSSDVLMTIKSIDNDILECRWFDKNDNIQNEKFNTIEISLVDKVENDHYFSGNEDEIQF